MEQQERVVSSPTETRSAEERMLRAELVQEIVARKERGEGIKRIARELSVDRKTVKRWLGLGGWQPRRPQRRARQLDRFAAFIERRAPEVGFNGVVLHRASLAHRDFGRIMSASGPKMVFSGAAQHANKAGGAGYFADSSRESADRGTRWRSGMDSNQRYRLFDAS